MEEQRRIFVRYHTKGGIVSPFIEWKKKDLLIELDQILSGEYAIAGEKAVAPIEDYFPKRYKLKEEQIAVVFEMEEV